MQPTENADSGPRPTMPILARQRCLGYGRVKAAERRVRPQREVRGNVPAYRGPFLLHYLDAVVYPDIAPHLLIAGAVAVCSLNLWIYVRRLRVRHSFGR